MTDKPDPAHFLIDERPREFEASIQVRGTMRIAIEADSMEEARRKAADLAAALEREPLDVELDDVEHVTVEQVWKLPPRYLVTRKGRPMQVEDLESGDLPRAPDANGL